MLDPSIPLSVKPIQLDNPLEVFSAIEQVKGQREAAELRRLAAEEARQRGIEAREERAEKKQLAELYADAVTVDPVNGQIRYDRDKLLAKAPRHLVPTLLDQLQKDEVRMNTLIKSGLDLDHARRVWLAEEAPDVIDAQGDPEVWKTTLLRARQTNSIDQATYEREVVLTDPAQILARAQRWMQRAAKDTDVVAVKTVNAQGQEVTKFVRKEPGVEYPAAPAAADLITVQTVDERGRPVTKIVPKVAGGVYPNQPPQASGTDLITVQTVDAQGRPVTKVVPKVAGAEYPNQPGGSGGLSAALQSEIATMLTAEQMANDVAKLGAETNWAGVGPWEGRVGASPLGSGGAKGETLRNQIGNIQATIALMRGGTSFTDTEKALLETYTPTTTDTDAKIKTKLTNLVDFIQKKRANVLRVASGQYELPKSTDDKKDPMRIR